MLYSEIIAVCSQIHTKHINTLCGQNVELVNVKPGGTYSYHWVLPKWLTSPGTINAPVYRSSVPVLRTRFLQIG